MPVASKKKSHLQISGSWCIMVCSVWDLASYRAFLTPEIPDLIARLKNVSVSWKLEYHSEELLSI